MLTPPSGTVTFLFTDIEGSTALAQAHSQLWPAMRARHHAILQSAAAAHAGSAFQVVGDAFCVAFSTPLDALSAALTAQRALAGEPWPASPIRVRMGLHTGPAAWHEGDYEGYLTLARVQRIMSLAHGAQVLLSGSTADLVRDDLPEGVRLRDLGEHRLKGVINPEHILQLVSPDLPAEFPPLQSLAVLPNNLPTPL